mmetsp:Transcript_33359/g.73759  ORF Transcript_33359/g.73759 Transcript_33359/m.73759 type:complete len:222 (-) Transcript_33359:216-881(-)
MAASSVCMEVRACRRTWASSGMYHLLPCWACPCDEPPASRRPEGGDDPSTVTAGMGSGPPVLVGEEPAGAVAAALPAAAPAAAAPEPAAVGVLPLAPAGLPAAAAAGGRTPGIGAVMRALCVSCSTWMSLRERWAAVAGGLLPATPQAGSEALAAAATGTAGLFLGGPPVMKSARDMRTPLPAAAPAPALAALLPAAAPRVLLALLLRDGGVVGCSPCPCC